MPRSGQFSTVHGTIIDEPLKLSEAKLTLLDGSKSSSSRRFLSALDLQGSSHTPGAEVTSRRAGKRNRPSKRHEPWVQWTAMSARAAIMN